MEAEAKVRKIFLEWLFDSSGISSHKEPLSQLGLLRMRSSSRAQERNSVYVPSEIMTRSLTVRGLERAMSKTKQAGRPGFSSQLCCQFALRPWPGPTPLWASASPSVTCQG